MKPDYEQMGFNTFARLHPVEAYDSDPVRFCNFVRETNPTMTDEEIKEIIEDLASTDMQISGEECSKMVLTFRGDSERDTLLSALKMVCRELEDYKDI